MGLCSIWILLKEESFSYSLNIIMTIKESLIFFCDSGILRCFLKAFYINIHICTHIYIHTYIHRYFVDEMI